MVLFCGYVWFEGGYNGGRYGKGRKRGTRRWGKITLKKVGTRGGETNEEVNKGAIKKVFKA